MKQGILFFVFFLLSLIQISITASAAAPFTVCKSEYALCTTATCTRIASKPGQVSCRCEVKKGYSAGQASCKGVKKTAKGQLIYSRYYPIKSYVACSNKRPWAWCLDKPCIVDKKNPGKAFCVCKLVQNLGTYVIVTDKYRSSTCTTGIISSATVSQVNQITEFLKTQKNLQPFVIKQMNN